MSAHVSLPVLFQCAPLGTRLTRRACGMRHLEARIAGKGGNTKRLVRDATCVDCKIGDQHASGREPTRWPDGEPIQLVTSIGTPQPPGTPPVRPVVLPPYGSHVAKPSKPVAPVAAPTPVTKEKPMPAHPKLHTHNGKTLSLDDWAKELGISRSCLGLRMKNETDPERIFAHGPLPKRTSIEGAAATLKPPIATKIKPVKAPITPAKMEKLARPVAPIDGVPVLETLSPAALLAAAGFKVIHATKVPAGFAIFVEAP